MTKDETRSQGMIEDKPKGEKPMTVTEFRDALAAACNLAEDLQSQANETLPDFRNGRPSHAGIVDILRRIGRLADAAFTVLDDCLGELHVYMDNHPGTYGEGG